MRYAFLGAGNMAGAIIRALRRQDVQVTAYDVNPSALETLADCGITPLNSPGALADTDVLFLAVKPQQAETALQPLKASLKNAATNPLIISIMAGISLGKLSNLLNDTTLPIVRVMPNINALVGESMSIYCTNANVTTTQLLTAQEALQSFGDAVEVPESQFSAASALAGCSPGYTLMYLDALATAGVKLGLTKQLALRLATQSTLGTAMLLREDGEHPRTLLDKICSPGGTTIQGIAALQSHAFEASVEAAVEASYTKDTQL